MFANSLQAYLHGLVDNVVVHIVPGWLLTCIWVQFPWLVNWSN